MSRADSTMRRKARKQKSGVRYRNHLDAREQMKREETAQIEEYRSEKLRWSRCFYSGQSGDPEAIYYGEGADQPLILAKVDDHWELHCGYCKMLWYQPTHP